MSVITPQLQRSWTQVSALLNSARPLRGSGALKRYMIWEKKIRIYAVYL